MPVNDPMYTAAQAKKLQAYVNRYARPDLYLDLEEVQAEAARVSSESAKVVMRFFEVLHEAMESDDPELAEAARRIFSGPYWVEIA